MCRISTAKLPSADGPGPASLLISQPNHNEYLGTGLSQRIYWLTIVLSLKIKFHIICYVDNEYLTVPVSTYAVSWITEYPKKYAHGFVVLCFVVVTQSFIMNSHEVFIHIHQGCFAGTGAIVRLPQCQWSKPDGYGKISQCITTTKHSKAVTVCIFLWIYCMRFRELCNDCLRLLSNVTDCSEKL